MRKFLVVTSLALTFGAFSQEINVVEYSKDKIVEHGKTNLMMTTPQLIGAGGLVYASKKSKESAANIMLSATQELAATRVPGKALTPAEISLKLSQLRPNSNVMVDYILDDKGTMEKYMTMAEAQTAQADNYEKIARHHKHVTKNHIKYAEAVKNAQAAQAEALALKDEAARIYELIDHKAGYRTSEHTRKTVTNLSESIMSHTDKGLREHLTAIEKSNFKVTNIRSISKSAADAAVKKNRFGKIATIGAKVLAVSAGVTLAFGKIVKDKISSWMPSLFDGDRDENSKDRSLSSTASDSAGSVKQ